MSRVLKIIDLFKGSRFRFSSGRLEADNTQNIQDDIMLKKTVIAECDVGLHTLLENKIEILELYRFIVMKQISLFEACNKMLMRETFVDAALWIVQRKEQVDF